MAYTINLTDGTIFAVIADGTINTSSSMTLVGKNYAGYGEFLDENFIHLLESGSNTTAPGAPLTGQLWWDQTTDTLKVYNGTNFKVISGATASPAASPPSNPVAGDLWYDSTNAQLNVYSGTAWIVVGPAFTAGTGVTGAIPDTITDNTATSHVVIKLFVQDEIVGIVSRDSGPWTPQTAIPGFASVNPGIQLATAVGGVNQFFQGTATNSQTLDGLDSTDFLSAIANDTTSGTLGVLNDGGLTVGSDSDLRLLVSGSDVFIRNQTSDSNIRIQVNDGGVNTNMINLYGANATVELPGTVRVNTSAQATAIFNAGGNGVGNIGSSSAYFNTVYATATTALYADVAERFETDIMYDPGTVVELGGTKEITMVRNELSDTVFGVISTKPAFTMNGGAGTDSTHPPVAMTGRVPVKTVGTVRKGDRLVSAGNGIARAAQPGEATAFNTIGRALADKLSDEVGTVEAIVTIK
jgi:hypothetical protein